LYFNLPAFKPQQRIFSPFVARQICKIPRKIDAISQASLMLLFPTALFCSQFWIKKDSVLKIMKRFYQN
jgi:hypothetical protein